MIRRFRKVVCKLDDDVLELLDVLPVLLDDVVANALGCFTAAGIAGVRPCMFICRSSQNQNLVYALMSNLYSPVVTTEPLRPIMSF